MASSNVPDIVVGRLPHYLRALTRMTAAGQEITSSHELGEQLGISSAQIRKDLSHFGEFGKQGTGYNITFLTEQLVRILRLQEEWQVALVGVGDLGRALAHYGGFQHRGFVITHIFDNDPQKVETRVADFVILPTSKLRDTIKTSGIRIAMLAVPASAAQEVCDMLVEAGIRAILNYAPTNLRTPKEVHVQHIDPVIHLQHMTYYL